MILKSLINSQLSKNAITIIRKYSSESVKTAASFSTKSLKVDTKPCAYRLLASVCIERMPIITGDMDTLEKRYSDLINELNIKKSLLSDHELRHLKDLEIAKKRKLAADQDSGEIVIETALDYEDKCLKQLQSFHFGERKLSINEPKDALSKKNASVLKTLDRVLDKKLILIVYDQTKSIWHLPKLEWNQSIDGSLRQTAERSVEQLDSSLKVEFLGNAPVALYKFKENETRGEKHYIFKAQYKSGADSFANVSKVDYAWVRKDELADFIKNAEYLECLNNFILDF